MPAKIPGYPAKKFGFLGYEWHNEFFALPPPRVEDPHPTRRYPDQNSLGLGSFVLLDLSFCYFEFSEVSAFLGPFAPHT